MKFGDKYTNVKKDEEDERMIISNDALAIGDMIEQFQDNIIKKIERVRMTLI